MVSILKRLSFVLFLFLFVNSLFSTTTHAQSPTVRTTPSCSVLISGELTLIDLRGTVPFTCPTTGTKEQCFDAYYQARIVATNSTCAEVPNSNPSFDYSLYQELKTKFISMDSVGATPTPPPISSTSPDSDTVPITGAVSDLDLDRFNNQLDQTLCTAYEGSACCMGAVAFDSQGLPDPSGESNDIKVGGIFEQLWKKLQSSFNSIFKGSQIQSTKAISALQWQQGLCPQNEESDLKADGVTPVEFLPYFWKADANGKATQELVTYADEDGNLIKEINRDLVQVHKLPFSKQEALWNEMKTKMQNARAVCTCNEPSEDGKTPLILASSGESTQNVLGAETKPEVLGTISPELATREDDLVSLTIKLKPYCTTISDTVRRERFASEEINDCALTMATSYFTAKEMCAPIMSLTDESTGLYNREEYEACFSCTLEDDGVWTALGCIYSDFGKTLNEKIFSLIISIAGLIALGCIIYASFLMQTSAGNPEKTGKAQELMTACITGLVVIIFSVFILRVIGVDILRIPGFYDADSDVPPSPTPNPVAAATATPIPAVPTPTIVAVTVVPGAATPVPTTIPLNTLTPGPTAAVPTVTTAPTPTTVVTPALAQYVCGTEPEANEVYLYDKESYQGPCLRLTMGQFENFSKIQNPGVSFLAPWAFAVDQCANWSFEDCLQSMKIGSNVQVELYYHRNYNGTPLRATSLDVFTDFNTNYSGKISSAIVCTKTSDFNPVACPRP